MSLIVFPPDTVILSFLCFMTVLQTPRLSQDLNYWWEMYFVALKLLRTLKRSSSVTGLLNCFCRSVAVSRWRTESVDYCWQAHNQVCLTVVPVHDRRHGCRHSCRLAESSDGASRGRQEVGKRWSCQEWFIHGAWSTVNHTSALLLPCQQAKCTHQETSRIKPCFWKPVTGSTSLILVLWAFWRYYFSRPVPPMKKSIESSIIVILLTHPVNL